MLHDSFDADLRSVLQRLAVTRPAGSPGHKGAVQPVSGAKLIPFRKGEQQPRLEIARVALRRNACEIRDVMT